MKDTNNKDADRRLSELPYICRQCNKLIRNCDPCIFIKDIILCEECGKADRYYNNED